MQSAVSGVHSTQNSYTTSIYNFFLNVEMTS